MSEPEMVCPKCKSRLVQDGNIAAIRDGVVNLHVICIRDDDDCEYDGYAIFTLSHFIDRNGRREP